MLGQRPHPTLPDTTRPVPRLPLSVGAAVTQLRKRHCTCHHPIRANPTRCYAQAPAASSQAVEPTEAQPASNRQQWRWSANVQQQQQQVQQPEGPAPPAGYRASEAYGALLLVIAFANLLFSPGGLWSFFTLGCAAVLVYAAARLSVHRWESNLRSLRAAALNLAVACYVGHKLLLGREQILGARAMLYVSWTFVAYFLAYAAAAVRERLNTAKRPPAVSPASAAAFALEEEEEAAARPHTTHRNDRAHHHEAVQAMAAPAEAETFASAPVSPAAPLSPTANEACLVTTTSQITMEEAVEQAIEQGLERQLQNAVENAFTDSPMRFDMKATANTLLAVTGVILYWRGVWTLWDVAFGYSVWSELGAIGSGLAVMLFIKYSKLPLAEWFPS